MGYVKELWFLILNVNVKAAKFDIDYLAPVGLHRRKKGDRGKPESTGADAEKSPKRPETAFDQLVLPKGHKEMVLSLIAQHFRNKVSASDQRDIVQGKGRTLKDLKTGRHIG